MHRRTIKQLALAFLLLFGLFVIVTRGRAQRSGTAFTHTIPKTWDDEAIASLEVPLANPVGSPKHVSSDYYYRIPVTPIYKSYPIYAPGHEPPDYIDWLKQQEPVILWDDAGHRPLLRSEEQWIKAGEMVFEAPVKPALMSLEDVRKPAWYEHSGMPIAKDGSLPIVRYVIKKKGTVEVQEFSCASCHTRLMPDGSILKGAQGNFPLLRPSVLRAREAARLADPSAYLLTFRTIGRASWSAPWLTPDPEARIDQMSAEELALAMDAVVPAVLPRHRASLLYPTQVPDLIGVKDRRYLDRTGLQPHRSIGDLMRYGAMNRGILDGGDGIANHNGFIPADAPRFQKLPDASTLGRYSDEQLYALALYIYSLQPPSNPNKFDALAEHGQKVFEREGCAMCHTPPLYTNNKLTPANGFTVPEDHLKKYDILPISVGTDPNLTLRTRRGTGYYKVPSLKGVWYRSMFGHSGWCATLEDWFDPRRTRDDYVPTGFKPYDVKTYAVKGHPFGLNLSTDDRDALSAFLKTL